MLDIVDETVTSGLWSDVRTTEGGTLTGQDTLPGVSVSLVCTEEVTDLSTTDTDITSRDISVVTNVPGQLPHEGVTETSDLVVGFALWVKVGTTLTTSHGESGQGILEDLLESEELEDGKVDGWVESETSLVWSEGRVVLHSETTVDLDLTLVRLPDYPELDDPLWDGNDLECLLVLWVSIEEGRRVKGRLELVVSLFELSDCQHR